MSDRSVHWALTINNPTSSDEETLALARGRGWEVDGQIEKGENGTSHYQLHVNCRSQQRFSAVKKVFPRAHIEKARSVVALKKYVHKEETRVAELPNSDRFVTSQKRLWDLVTSELQHDMCDKRHKIYANTDEPFDEAVFKPLDALDYAVDKLMRQGYHCVESMAVNPAVRAAWSKFWRGAVARALTDRQTDRQSASGSDTQSVTIDINATTDEDDEGSEGSGLQSSDGTEDEDECSTSEGSDDGEGSSQDS